MLVIKMIRRITGLNQEELSDFLGVSRASVNTWENSNAEMTIYQKKIICEKFNIPIELLDEDLKSNIEIGKIIYKTIQSTWDKLKKENMELTEEEFLNKIEREVIGMHKETEISDYEMIEGLTKGYDPYTGEVFEEEHILNDEKVRAFLTNIKNKYYKYGTDELSKEELSPIQRQLFEEIRKWRKDMMVKEGFFSAYMVFTDKELINIVTAKTETKNDLLNIKGIGKIKYEKYGDDIFNILTSGGYDFIV